MAITLTPDEVKAFCASAGGLTDADITMYINVVSRASTCMDNAGVDDDTQRLLLLNAVCHLLTKKYGGKVQSQRDFDGASITFAKFAGEGTGLSSTSFGQTIQSLDLYGCFSFLNRKPTRFMLSVGR